jgi:hypothetical protein
MENYSLNGNVCDATTTVKCSTGVEACEISGTYEDVIRCSDPTQYGVDKQAGGSGCQAACPVIGTYYKDTHEKQCIECDP